MTLILLFKSPSKIFSACLGNLELCVTFKGVMCNMADYCVSFPGLQVPTLCASQVVKY